MTFQLFGLKLECYMMPTRLYNLSPLAKALRMHKQYRDRSIIVDLEPNVQDSNKITAAIVLSYNGKILTAYITTATKGHH